MHYFQIDIIEIEIDDHQSMALVLCAMNRGSYLAPRPMRSDDANHNDNEICTFYLSYICNEST